MPITLMFVIALASSSLVTVTPRPCGVVVAAPPTTPPATPGTATAPLSTCPWPSMDQAEAVTIRMYDRSTTKSGQRLQAQAVSEAALQSTGVHPVWKDCVGTSRENPDSARCREPLGARELIVRFEDAPSRTPPSVLGFAYVPGVIATVLVDRVRHVAERSDTAIGELLGGVMAHEIMHLLIGSKEHDPGGLMQATWTDDDVKHGRIWSLQLTRSQRDSLLVN